MKTVLTGCLFCVLGKQAKYRKTERVPNGSSGSSAENANEENRKADLERLKVRADPLCSAVREKERSETPGSNAGSLETTSSSRFGLASERDRSPLSRNNGDRQTGGAEQQQQKVLLFDSSSGKHDNATRESVNNRDDHVDKSVRCDAEETKQSHSALASAHGSQQQEMIDSAEANQRALPFDIATLHTAMQGNQALQKYFL